jgi:hypothetical protein
MWTVLRQSIDDFLGPGDEAFGDPGVGFQESGNQQVNDSLGVGHVANPPPIRGKV